MPALVGEIEAGATVLLVSDAGMPLISDPGYRLVTACIEAGAPVHCLPGSVGGDDGACGVRAAVGEVLLRGLRAAQALGAACPGSTRWPPSRGRACSSSHRGGWRTACATPSTRSGTERARRSCAAS